jgi:hypothetical protein
LRTFGREGDPQHKAYRVFNKIHGIIEEAYDVEFDETNGSQDENENLDDVGGVM